MRGATASIAISTIVPPRNGRQFWNNSPRGAPTATKSGAAGQTGLKTYATHHGRKDCRPRRRPRQRRSWRICHRLALLYGLPGNILEPPQTHYAAGGHEQAQAARESGDGG